MTQTDRERADALWSEVTGHEAILESLPWWAWSRRAFVSGRLSVFCETLLTLPLDEGERRAAEEHFRLAYAR